jgi:Ca2+-transporting ATPase
MANARAASAVQVREAEPSRSDALGKAHAETPEQALQRLESRTEGLADAEARDRLARHGPNIIERAARDSVWRILFRQIDNPLIWVLVGAAVVAMALGELTDGLVVVAVVVLNALIGFVQEYRARDAIESLAHMVPEFANVLREGRLQSIAVRELVPGDVVQVASGDRIPADMRVLALKGLRVDEAALTGESTAVRKSLAAVSADAQLGDQTSMLFGGTLVRAGTATGVVVSTGARTELGRISRLIEEATSLETPLTRTLSEIGKLITIGILIVTAVMLLVGTLRGVGAGLPLFDAMRDTLVFAIALAVGAIPEGLPAIVTIALAIGVRRMAARHAIIRKLPAVETLGSTTVICSDKTGTLTRNEMTVRALWSASTGDVRVEGIGYTPTGGFRRRDDEQYGSAPAELSRLIETVALCSDASLEAGEAGHTVTGDPTEGALVVVAEKAGVKVEALRKAHPRRDVIPFESEQLFMATLNSFDEGPRILVKGALEALLPRIDSAQAAEAAEARTQLEILASEGMRVLAVAEKAWTGDKRELSLSDLEGGLTLLGLVAMLDPPREEAVRAIAACHQAGIEVKMITGDHLFTARAIGKELGLAAGRAAVQGSELARADEQGLAKMAREATVFARVSPEHKLRLVEAMQSAGEVVAMTGDGVNDAPALKQANIGVAMGITGTSVSKEAADMVLVDDNFATIVAAVEEGRRVYDNLIKSLVFVLPTNLALALIMIVAVFAFPFDPVSGTLLLPIAPAQLLWINLVAAVSLALPLAFEAKEPDVMQRPPRAPDAPVMSREVIVRTVFAALLMTACVVGLFRWEVQRYAGEARLPENALAVGQSMAVTTAIAFQIFYLFQCRSLRAPMLEVGFLTNRWVFVGVLTVIVLQAAFLFLPPLQGVFRSAPLSVEELLWSVAAGAAPLPLIGLEKRLWRALRKP